MQQKSDKDDSNFDMLPPFKLQPLSESGREDTLALFACAASIAAETTTWDWSCLKFPDFIPRRFEY
jgi:hypothetical protein